MPLLPTDNLLLKTEYPLYSIISQTHPFIYSELLFIISAAVAKHPILSMTIRSNDLTRPVAISEAQLALGSILSPY